MRASSGRRLRCRQQSSGGRSIPKIVTTKLGNDAGIASVPNVIGKATSWSSLKKLAAKEKLGTDLVVQLPYEDSGRTTFFIKTE